MFKTIHDYLEKFIRQGVTFQAILSEMESLGLSDVNLIKAYQDQQLRQLIHHCYTNVPYYRHLFHSLHLCPDDFQSTADLTKLPYLDKKSVRQHFHELRARNIPKFMTFKAYTSGTTGTPAVFLRDYKAINTENAFLWRSWRKIGDNGKRRLTLREERIVPASRDRPPYWRYNPASGELLISTYHLSKQTVRDYIPVIHQYRPEILYTFPSAAILLARLMALHGVHYQFDAILTSSETLRPEQRKEMEAAFGCKVFDWYGQSERVAAIGECEKNCYHILEDYSIVELVDTDNGAEIVGTHLHNDTMPLLRYRTGDYVQRVSGDESACPCGSPFQKIQSVTGRQSQYIVTPEGRVIPFIDLTTCTTKNILESQFVQEKPGELTINLVAAPGFNVRDRKQLLDHTLKYTSPRMKVEIREMNQIPRGSNGKFPHIISHLDQRLYLL